VAHIIDSGTFDWLWLEKTVGYVMVQRSIEVTSIGNAAPDLEVLLVHQQWLPDIVLSRTKRSY